MSVRKKVHKGRCTVGGYCSGCAHARSDKRKIFVKKKAKKYPMMIDIGNLSIAEAIKILRKHLPKGR